MAEDLIAAASEGDVQQVETLIEAGTSPVRQSIPLH